MRAWWTSWKATLLAVAAVVAIGSLASASPSLRQPRGPHLSSTGATDTSDVVGSTGAPAGATGETDANGSSRSSAEPNEDGGGHGPDFGACEGLTGLDNAICRHEVLLAIHPDDEGLQNALDHLVANRDEHEGGPGANGHGHEPSSHHGPSDGAASDEASVPSPRHSGEEHGNAGGNGKGNAGGNGKGNAGGNGKGNAGGNGH